MKNNLDRAKIYYKQAADAGNITAINNLGAIYAADSNEREMGIYYLKKALAMTDDKMLHKTITYNLATAYDLSNKSDDAILNYEKAITFSNPRAMYALATLYVTQKEYYKKAEELYLQAIQFGHQKSIGALIKLYQKVERHEDAFLLGLNIDQTSIRISWLKYSMV